jgi:hypothetical protein
LGFTSHVSGLCIYPLPVTAAWLSIVCHALREKYIFVFVFVFVK